MITEKERKSHEELFKLMQDNPDLPVIPFVDGEIVAGDDFGIWMGSWGTSCVDEYLIPPQNYKPVIFKSDDDVFDTLEKFLPGEEFDILPESEEECRKVFDALPWTKAIVVNIDLPG
ncbi:hypothetical protein [Acutalibacter sp. 1XD8-36]|uniref:hypothetical protein n=1 Tax=Acutalibacter sp. 1XD8-36 TaxID=2320852 RepID=UPI0014136CAD|nr:hypothetical protein [Acutalibacter sp. 1XD8-36]NBJ87907.1 hypothetical protein [Acutalibacter sp. 1XD8-36]